MRITFASRAFRCLGVGLLLGLVGGLIATASARVPVKADVRTVGKPDAAPEPLIPAWTRSVQIYGQPHAVWLDRYERVGANRNILRKVLKAATEARRTPELVIYAIPLRDLGQSSEGGFSHLEDYLADNRINAALIADFATRTNIRPVVYLEPDALPLAIQYRRDRHDDAESRRIYTERVRAMRALIVLYRKAGAKVYLEGGHSGWFDYGDADIQRIADTLNEAGISRADGLATNVSNRQPVTAHAPDAQSELHYLRRLLPLLENTRLDIRVDTSRNGGPTRPRHYRLASDGGLWDDETPQWRRVGRWKRESGEIIFLPYYGKPKTLSRLIQKEKYTYDPPKEVLTAPAWLDAVGDVQPGPPPTDRPPTAPVIHHYRYIKPPDDCDGALNYPPGQSKRDINALTARRNRSGGEPGKPFRGDR